MVDVALLKLSDFPRDVKAAKARADRMLMMTSTVSSSTSEKPRRVVEAGKGTRKVFITGLGQG